MSGPFDLTPSQVQQEDAAAGTAPGVATPADTASAAGFPHRTAWQAQREEGLSLLGRCLNSIRVVIGTVSVLALRYLRLQIEIHTRHAVARWEHYIVMRLFQLFGRSYPVTVDYPNPVKADGRRLVMQFNLCENHAIYFRRREKYEQEWVELISAGMQRAQSFIDVGAHAGMYALAIAQAYPDRKIVALEPHPLNFRRLLSNIRLNRLQNIEAIQAAVTDQPSPVNFFLNPIHDGGGSLRRIAVYRTGDKRQSASVYQSAHPHFQDSIQVETRRLGEIVTLPSIVKIDVEGAEIDVLRSGERAFRLGLVEMAVVEVDQDRIGEVLDFFDSMAFDCYLYGRRLPLKHGDTLRYRVENVLVVRRGSIACQTIDFN